MADTRRSRPVVSGTASSEAITPNDSTLPPAWTCESCGESVTLRGALTLRYAELWAHEAAREAWEAGTGTYPERVRWHVLHDDCTPAGVARGGEYMILAEQLATWQDVAGWTAHLIGKPWLPSTDWGALLIRAGAKDGTS